MRQSGWKDRGGAGKMIPRVTKDWRKDEERIIIINQCHTKSHIFVEK